jgi:hypothetical protein
VSERSGPIYEVRLFVDRDVAAECDQWLAEHVRESLQIASIADCNVFSVSSDNPDRVGRVCQHVLEADEEVDAFLDSLAAQIETTIASRYGDKVEFTDRVLREDDTHDIPSDESPICLNCGSHLRGQYCGNCGQRSRGRLIKLWQLISEAFGDLFEIDSRLWQTLVPLVIRPGKLTHDYLQGRRARFMPPFRMYLVLSLIFFVVAFFNPREELGIFFEAPIEQESATEAEEGEKNEDEENKDSGFIVFDEDDEDDCEINLDDTAGLPGFLARRLTPERIQQVCEQIVDDEGKTLLEKVINNVPTALIVLLPLMALVLKALYPLSRRYYVEHLLFFVHLHAFFFLLFTLQILFVRLTAAISVPEWITTLVVVASSVYVPIYLFVAMRRVYAQGRIVTFMKYITLMIAYLMGFSTIMALTFALAAFSI